MQQVSDEAVSRVGSVLLGKGREVRQALCCLLSSGHLLLEDLPGMGKTTLAHAMADVLGLSYARVQFTSDLLPSDILGVSIFNRREEVFEFRQGPIFNQLLLADEINRATPRTQSALLEAMAEDQVSIDGVTRPLPQPFFVIATQNPIHQSGTYALPESQLDRFLMRLSLGYPDHDAEQELLLRGDQQQREPLEPCITALQLAEIRQMAAGVAGMSTWVTPSASVSAEITACGAPMAPASPDPFTPRTLFLQGMLRKLMSKRGRSSARGTQ